MKHLTALKGIMEEAGVKNGENIEALVNTKDEV